MTQETAVTSVLFDVDGLLLNTEIVYTKVTQKIAARFGKTFDWSIKANMIGRAETESARYLVDTLDLPISAEDYLEERNDMLRKGLAKCDAMSGAEALVRHLKKENVPIAVATSSTTELFEIKKSRHTEWFSLFDVTVTGDDSDVTRAKPAPDIFLTAACRLGTEPQETMVFEDAPSGLAAGITAGMRVIVVPDPNMDRARYQGATEILNSLEDFKPERYALPAYK
ncbi:MAG: HAD-IA family hydrolase [Arenicellales bacterium]